jgi:hypothetical protein
VPPAKKSHISDFHLRDRDAWSQDVVLRAMCEAIARQRREGTRLDFVLATGDVAGKPEDYRLAAGFFDAVSAASGVPKALIFKPGDGPHGRSPLSDDQRYKGQARWDKRRPAGYLPRGRSCSLPVGRRRTALEADSWVKSG